LSASYFFYENFVLQGHYEITITGANLVGLHNFDFSSFRSVYAHHNVTIASMTLSQGAIPALEDTSEDLSEDAESQDNSTTSFREDSETDQQDHGKTSTQQDDIVGQDSVGVSRSRRMVMVMLLLTASLVITTTYLFLSREETDEFEKSVSFLMLGIQQVNDHSHTIQY
jgi:hypothetical protein